MDQREVVVACAAAVAVEGDQEEEDVVAERWNRDSEPAGPDDRKGKAVVHQEGVGCNLAAADSSPSRLGVSVGSNWSFKLPDLWDLRVSELKKSAALTFKEMPF